MLKRVDSDRKSGLARRFDLFFWLRADTNLGFLSSHSSPIWPCESAGKPPTAMEPAYTLPPSRLDQVEGSVGLAYFVA